MIDFIHTWSLRSIVVPRPLACLVFQYSGATQGCELLLPKEVCWRNTPKKSVDSNIIIKDPREGKDVQYNSTKKKTTERKKVKQRNKKWKQRTVGRSESGDI